jgi:hypothetical protein
MTKHTPTPWMITSTGIEEQHDYGHHPDKVVLDADWDGILRWKKKEDKEFFLKAIANHDALVKMLEWYVSKDPWHEEEWKKAQELLKQIKG